MIVVRNVFQLKSLLRSCTTRSRARGVKFETKPRFVARMPDDELWMAFFRDPDGNPLELMGEVRRV
jgi:methylmalonyl-CoA/ethylmalonyl-CoA epimerase